MNEDNGMKDILCINVGKLNTDTSVNLFQTLIRERTGVTYDHHLDNFFLFLVIWASHFTHSRTISRLISHIQVSTQWVVNYHFWSLLLFRDVLHGNSIERHIVWDNMYSAMQTMSSDPMGESGSIVYPVGKLNTDTSVNLLQTPITRQFAWLCTCCVQIFN